MSKDSTLPVLWADACINPTAEKWLMLEHKLFGLQLAFYPLAPVFWASMKYDNEEIKDMYDFFVELGNYARVYYMRTYTRTGRMN